jgi:hypothetical protein
MNTCAREIGRRFLQDIDNHLKENIHSLTCNDIHAIYDAFFKDLKEYNGNSNNFTGLSEYLIFKSFIHSLRESYGDFKLVKAPEGSLPRFVPISEQNISIGHSESVYIDKKRYNPDICVFINQTDLVSVVQIKVCLTKGWREIENEKNIIKGLREKYGPEM